MMKLCTVLTVCIAVGSVKLASSFVITQRDGDVYTEPTPKPATDSEKPEQSLPALGRPLPRVVMTDPISLLKAFPTAANAFIDTLNALTTNQPTSPRCPPCPRCRPRTAHVHGPYFVFPNPRVLFTMLLRQTLAPYTANPLEPSTTTTAGPKVWISEESPTTTTPAEPELLTSEVSSTANPIVPEDVVFGENPQLGSGTLSNPQYSNFKSDIVTSAPDVYPSDSTTAVIDHANIVKLRNEFVFRRVKPRKFSVPLRRTDHSLEDNEIPNIF